MAEGPQLLHVTDIANDDQKLVELVRKELKEWRNLEIPATSSNITLEQNWVICNEGGKDLGTADRSIRALLVTQKGKWGAVRVDSDPVTNVVTGKGDECYIVFIEPGQVCRFYQQPAVRYFRLQGS
ncbi:uncharacterized protein BO97DRAFT_441685 [Aspergillus homomorphus CBS 101889]|uniref:Uncharacterized protein n=1 Tax=Aspergillus homomorphus (strain CBS 101889) TaxID=1450537 RepID=A0A395I3A3_ASPHC|nr:hypothetical protein BO97DRAFT_441685 [Aspergillus homomorphus CBS 101889]RAL14196.1 hypothetical protein BO97DRAFT_441685 [Aspergillus homomorphus CBS 101889]